MYKIMRLQHYRLFSDLRSLSGTTLMTMLASMFMAQLIYVVGVGGVQDKELCLSISFSLEYLDLATLCWLSVLCYEVWITSLSIPPLLHSPGVQPFSAMCYRFAKRSLISWGCPALCLASAFYLQQTDDVRHLYKYNCWFLEEMVYIPTYLLPSATLIFFDICVLVRARSRLELALALEPEHRVRSRTRKRCISRLALCAKFLGTSTLVVCLSGCVRLGLTSFPMWIAFNACRSAQGAVVAIFAACHSKALGPSKIKKRFPTRSASMQVLTWSPIPDTV